MIFVVFFLLSVAFSILINGLFLKFSGTLGSKNSGDKTMIRWGSTSKPAMGGISFFIVFLLSFSLFTSFFSTENINAQHFGILLATSLGFLVGLADDAYNTKPFLKFIGQFACAIILIVSDVYIQLFDIEWLNYFLTIFWVIGMMNSINMLDNMDAITTSVSIGAITLILLILITLNQTNDILFWLCLGVLASLLGFLYYNWNPSRMYMGDTGSQFLGVLLAALGILFFWNGYEVNDTRWFTKFITPILAFLPSIVDTTTVTINRLAKGTSPFVGGRDHTTHHLSYFGFTDRQIALIFLGLSLLSAAICLYVNYYMEQWNGFIIITTIGYALIVFVLLFGLTKRKNQNS